MLRIKHYSIRTERGYLDWIKRHIFFHNKTHPAQIGAPEVEAFLSHLALAGKVAASAQNQAKKRAAVSLSRGVGARVAVAGQCDAGKKTATIAGGVDGKRGQVGAEPVGWDVVVDGEPTSHRGEAELRESHGGSEGRGCGRLRSSLAAGGMC